LAHRGNAFKPDAQDLLGVRARRAIPALVSAAMASTEPDRRDALVERLFESTIGALELYSVHLGWRLGLYRALRDAESLTPTELAAAAGIDERYAREWLEQQAVAGFLEVEDAEAPADARRFRLPADHADVLTDPDSPVHVAPFAPLVVGVAGAMPRVLDAYRSGAGVAYEHYGADFRDGQGLINRPAFGADMAGWLASSPEIHERLSREGARVADVGCGQGYSTVAIARAYPGVAVDGIDLDEPSVADARAYAATTEVAGRLSFVTLDGGALSGETTYDLVCIFEALHDMSRPVEALAAARGSLGPGGSVLVADERVAEAFAAPGDQVERIMYGWSVVHCLPVSRAEQPSAALGTALRESTVRALAEEAGFASVEVLPVENDFFRFYRLVP
jgi:2-polyprenyl-3-methyl-5-hydroxy-6-metoxy-1,4-benzoquinol methylase